MPIDGKVNGLNRPVFETLQKVKNPKDMSGDEAKALRNAVLQDGRIDENEKDLLQELTQDSNQIQISAQGGTGRGLQFSAAKGAAKDKLSMLTNPPNLNTLWEGGAEGIRKMVDFYNISPATKERVAHFLSVKLEGAWESSSAINAFTPMVKAVGATYNAINGDPEADGPGRELLLSALDKVNQRLSAHNKSPIHPFLYNWIRPGGYL